MDKHAKQGGNEYQFTCPDCGSTNVSTKNEQQTFLYGKQGVSLSAVVPVRSCGSCDFRFTDWEAEEARDKATRKYLHLPSADEIEAVRKKYLMSREEFAAISGFGSASLARWETNTLIPNLANARYLFLLSFDDNIARLKAKDSSDQGSVDLPSVSRPCRSVFPAIPNLERATACAGMWKLRRPSKRNQ